MNHQEKFQGLLRQMFQFDSADLDFGIYRIMNFKRDAIERFIQKDLIQAVSKELGSGALADQAQTARELQETATEICKNFGEAALDGEGVLSDSFRSTPLGKRYLDLQGRSSGAQSRPALEASIFNHMYAFFSRYYDNGDFMSKRRYGRKERYAIPYNGEEVYLHWANADQYYIKTGEYFTDYRFKTRSGVTIHFKLQAADVAKDNVKGDKRFFLPVAKDADFDGKRNEITIPFEFRPLTSDEQIKYGKSNQQDGIIAEALDKIPATFKGRDGIPAKEALAEVHHSTDAGENVSQLAHHLRRYARKNTSDFFIHKDLKGFLIRELDFYLKNEVLALDDLEATGETRSEGWFQMMRVIRAVGERIIEFLTQIEEFQKMLFEKKKFITETQYCITVANIPEEFYADIAANDAQWLEWKELFHIDEGESTLFSAVAKSKMEKRNVFLKSHPTLVLDTRHFDITVKERILESFRDIEALTDGLIINSDNFQALGLLAKRFHKQIECTYIDPPYNTGDSEILYKNEYLMSSWMTLMQNRIARSIDLMTEDSILFIAIDDFEMVDLCELIDRRFPSLRREMIVINHHPQGGKAKTLANTHEYMLACVSRSSDRTLTGRISDDGVEERPFKRSGTAESNFRYGRPNSFYAILVDPKTHKVVGLENPPEKDSQYPTKPAKNGHVRVYPLGSQGEERVWRRSYESCINLVQENQLICSDQFTIYQLIKAEDRTPALFSNWVDSRYNAGTWGANLLGDIIGEHNPFSYPKSIYTLEDSLFAAGIEGDSTCLDYFAGSGTTGHAVININRADGEQRHFILVEMGEYFDSVLLPRIKKVIFSPEWKNGKPTRQATQEEADRSPRVVKYLRLESYEDTLNNITFDEDASQSAFQFDDYLLGYMLKWETRVSETLLNIEKLASPFSYKLTIIDGQEVKVKHVDIPETFTYLIGLYVKTRRVLFDRERKYLIYRGTIDHREVVVIWRDIKGWEKKDYEQDKAFVAAHKLVKGADEVFVNGDSLISEARSLDSVFKARMFGRE